MRALLTGLLCVLAFSCMGGPMDQPYEITEGVFVNQEGFLPQAEKYFISNVETRGFTLVESNSGNEVFRGTLELRTEIDESTGLRLFVGDFSAFTELGRYKVVLDSGHESYTFSIDPDLYDSVAMKSIKSFYFQRCGVALEEPYAGLFSRPPCHLDDALLHSSVPDDRTLAASGGWHDAGDYGKYIHSAATGLAMMTILYEQFPQRFSMDHNNIPESGNGFSDFLDEIAFELDWMLTMQNRETQSPFHGACHYMINTTGYAWGTPDNEPYTRYAYNYSTVATADFCAIMAQAARLFLGIDDQRSQAYEEAALLGWAYLEGQEEIFPPGGFARPSDTHTGGYCLYADENDRDDRMWAAVELYITTGEESYHRRAIDLGLEYHEFGLMSWESTYDFARMQYLLTNRPVDSDIHGTLRNALFQFNEDTLNRIEADGFMDSMEEYFWGGNGALMLHGQYLLLGAQLFPEQKERYEQAALRLMNYLLGTNPHNMSFVTKVGTVYPLNIHHAAMEGDGIAEVYPGVVAGGPNQHTDEFPRATPPGLCYMDEYDSYATNENCILYNAPLVGVAFYFATFHE